MRKRINLQVDKLIAKPIKKQKPEPERVPPEKPLSFEQMYQMARKTSSQCQSRIQTSHTALSSSNTSQQLAESLKNSRQTPQNSTRNCRRSNVAVTEKLNRSLQTKVECPQGPHTMIRSFSGGKRRATGQQAVKERQCRQVRLESTKPKRKNTSPAPSENAQFEQEYRAAIAALDHNQHQHLRQTECFLGIQQTFQLLKQLHYLRRIEDEKYLVRMWQELEGQTYGGVPSDNLFEFLTYVNHYDPSNYYPKNSQPNHSKKIIINSNLKIVASEKSKLDIYQEYLALRVNRILYGDNDQPRPKTLHRTSNIKIVEEQVQLNSQKDQGRKKLSFTKKNTSSEQLANNPPRRAVRLKSNHHPRTRQFEDLLKFEGETETQNKPEMLQTKESGKNLTSNQSETSIQSGEEQAETRKAVLSIDVNLGEGVNQKLVVYQGQSAVDVSHRLVQKYNIDDSLRLKFQAMLSGHLRNLLWRIEQVSEEMFSDREE